MRLTKNMLDAMLTALAELLAGEGPQGYNEDDGEKVMENAEKAKEWIHQELNKRNANKKSQRRSNH